MSSSELDTRTRILETTWALLEKQPGQSLSMGKIAKASGISRQALYLHFTSRAELLIATTRYVDEVKELNQRLEKIQQCSSGQEMLQVLIKEWGNYIPEVYGVSKALMMTKDTDEAAAKAWSEIMGCLYDVCVEIIKKLSEENKRSLDWDEKSAADFLWTLISIQSWEQLTLECNWSNDQYISHITQTVMASIVSE